MMSTNPGMCPEAAPPSRRRRFSTQAAVCSRCPVLCHLSAQRGAPLHPLCTWPPSHWSRVAWSPPTSSPPDSPRQLLPPLPIGNILQAPTISVAPLNPLQLHPSPRVGCCIPFVQLSALEVPSCLALTGPITTLSPRAASQLRAPRMTTECWAKPKAG